MRFFSILCGAALIALLVAALAFKVEVALVATLAMGVICLAWLVAIVVLPWNLLFRARHLLAEMARSERRGIAVDAEARIEAKQVASRMFRLSVALHLVSALLLCLGSFLLGQRLGYAFAGLFLLSTLFRPAVEYYRYLHAKLGGYLNEVKVPREDAVKLAQDVSAVVARAQGQHEALEKLTQELAQLTEAMKAGDQENGRKLDAVARKFEETIDRLTDNQEIIAGIKAFLRLIQAPH